MNIYLITGYAGSGKSHVGTVLQSIVAAHRTSFAKQVKDDVAEMYRFPRALCDTQEGKRTSIKTENGNRFVRELLIEYATSAKQITENPSVWADFVVKEIINNPDKTTWIIDDWRFKEEYRSLRRAFPSATIHRFRIHNTTVKPSADPSEHDLDDERMDYVILNTSDDELVRLLQMYKS